MKNRIFYLLIILTLISGLIGIFPILQKPTSPYYVYDPDPAYVANGLEYLQIHKEFMSDHPGSPLVVYLSVVFFPIKIYTKLAGVSSFTQWAVEHFALFMWVAKLSVFILFLSGLFIFHISIYSLFKSSIVNIFFFFGLFLVPYFVGFQGLVTPENVGFFFMAIWFYFMSRYLKTSNGDYITLGSVFAGLAMASKYVFIFAAIATFLVSMIGITDKKIRKSVLLKLIINTAVIFVAFMMGIIPIMTQWGRVFYWAYYLLTTVGVPGAGGAGIFTPSVFWTSFTNWFGGSYVIFVGFILLALTVLWQKGTIFWRAVFISSILGLVVFMKYLAIHYQFVNILLLVLCLVFLFSKLSGKLKIIVILLTCLFSFRAAKADVTAKRNDVLNAVRIQNFVDQLPRNGFYIWQDSASEDFSLVRAKDWSGLFYSEELKKYRPNLWTLNNKSFGIIINNEGQRYSIDDFCWDGLFLNRASWNDFLNGQKNPRNYSKVEIAGSEDVFVTRKECSNENLHPKALNFY